MKKTADTKNTLLETAINLIWQSNYHRVGVNEICQQAGVTKGCFYHYFDSKAALFDAAAAYSWEQKKAKLNEIFAPTYTPLEQLENIVAYIIESQECHCTDTEGDNPVSGCPFVTAGAMASAEDASVRLTARDMAVNMNLYNAALIKNLLQGGYLNSKVDAEQTGRMLSQYVQGLLLYARVFSNLDIVRQDLREGIYRMIDLKPEYRKQAVRATAEAVA